MEFFLYSFKRRKNFIWTRPITFLIIRNEIGEGNRDATINKRIQDDGQRLGLITLVNTKLVEIVVISPPFHDDREAKIVKFVI